MGDGQGQLVRAQFPIPFPGLFPPPPIGLWPSQPSRPPIIGDPNAWWNWSPGEWGDWARGVFEARPPSKAVEKACDEQLSADFRDCEAKARRTTAEAGPGFVVWWHEKGDFDFFDFWSYQPRPTEYCLQSAYQDAASDAFTKANEGKVLMPSHRVAIEPDRPGITTYAVQADGTDRLAGFIGPEDMKGTACRPSSRSTSLRLACTRS